MAITVNCPNGHTLKVKDEFAGKTGLCPHCRAKVNVPRPDSMSDDDILEVLGPSAPAPGGSGVQSTADYASLQESGIVTVGGTARSRKKMCPQCKGETSVAFTNCPRCGTPLPTPPGGGQGKGGKK